MGFVLIFVASFFENYGYKKINTSTQRNFTTSIVYITSALILFLIGTFTELNFNFLDDKKFYILLFLESAVAYLYREIYYRNHAHYTLVNLFVFSTVYLMPIVAFFYDGIFSFEGSLRINYEGFYEAFVFSITLMVLTFFYYRDKISSQEINGIPILLLLLIFMLHSMYFAIKMIQSYNGFLLFSFIHLWIGFLFFLFALRVKENFSLSLEQTRKIWYIPLLWPFIFTFVILGASMLAVEFVTNIKRIGQILTAYYLDKRENLTVFSLKDKIVIFLLIVVTIVFYLYKVSPLG